MTITITHTLAEGTLVHGTERGDGTGKILGGKGGCGFRLSRNLGAWYLPHSRDRVSKTWVIRDAEQRLTEAGHTVTVEIDDASPGRDFGQAEAERYERAQNRADRYGERGTRASRAGASRWERNRGLMSHIPMGQPILVGHHSERRHRNFLDRMWRSDGRAVKDMQRGEYWAERAQTAAKYRERRENLPRTLRRIEKLEAMLRSLDRQLAEALEATAAEEGEAPAGGLRALARRVLRRTPAPVPVPDSPAAIRLRTIREQTEAQLDYWREHVASREAEGEKVWGPGDFSKGDFALHSGRWFEVIRVNPKTLTVPWQHYRFDRKVLTVEAAEKAKRDGGRMHTDRVGYDGVRGRMSAQEMAAKLKQQAPQDT